MGFSNNLQGKSAHEALLGRQDAEFQLMDTMCRCLLLRAKCDREYAAALSSLSSQGLQGALEYQGVLAGSLIAQAWQNAMEEVKNFGNLIQQNADQLECGAVKQLNRLQLDKKNSRKEYQDEHARIGAMFNQLSENVAHKKGEYHKSLEAYKLLRSRFEEHYIKAGRCGRKLDDMCDKYQKACRKLHLTHNEYVLLLAEVREFEKDYRADLLPGLLDYQQAVQEATIRKWQTILLEAFQICSLSTAKFQEMQMKLEKQIKVIQPSEEYKEFMEKYKTEPIKEKTFAFDEGLLEGISGKLLPNVVVVDNLTIDWLRNKVGELETCLHEQQALAKGKEIILAQAKSRLKNLDGSYSASVQCLGSDQIVASWQSVSESSECAHSPAALLHMMWEIRKLQCCERKLKRLVEMVRTPLMDLGCEEAPAACDLSSDMLSSDGNSRIPSVGEHILKSKKQSQHIVSLLCKPFHRKSSLPLPCISTPLFSKRLLMRRDSIEGGGKEEEAGIGSVGGCVTAKNHVPAENKSQSSLSEEEWFHGCLPREDVVRLFTQDGDFLVRETTRNDEQQIVLSVNWCGPKHFIVQTTPEGQYRFEGPAFPTVQELIAHQIRSGLPVTARSGAILKRSIVRECWELNNDDVVLDVKIGRGNFGDVYKAYLKPNKQDIAVKTCKIALPEEHKKKFLQEARILKQYDHPNVVKFIGICVQKQPIMIVMELVPGGSLLAFLRKHAAFLPLKNLLFMCRDVAAGMNYLESKNCIHRDLAARNCLVGHNNIVKISDFGMSREEEEYIVSDGMKQIPIKWTAPEALNFGKYTSLCDVWSYGVLVWEIFACGGTPYSGLSNSKAREKIDSGYRMPAPEGTPPQLYELMLRCWEYDPEKRPHFEEIYRLVDNLLFIV